MRRGPFGSASAWALQCIPPHMRDLQSLLGIPLESRDAAGQHAEPRDVGCLVASLEEPLHAEADPEQWRSRAHGESDGMTPWADKGVGGREVPDPGHDQRREARAVGW